MQTRAMTFPGDAPLFTRSGPVEVRVYVADGGHVVAELLDRVVARGLS